MDYHPIDNQPWAWQGDDLFLQADTNLEDISFMFEETTPIKECGDLAYHFDDFEIVSKTPQEGKEYSSQIKRRRVLDFNGASEEISSSFLKSKERIDAHDAVLPEVDDCLQDQFSPPLIEDFGQSEAWLAECLNDTYLNISSDDGNVSASSDVQIISKECNNTPDSTTGTVQRPVRSSRNIIFKGRKSYMRTPSKVPSSVAYPFDFIKPCGVGGGVTLKDINQRILTPPPSKPKEVKEDVIYPTSAFSGKPVVGKTKIPTQGGKGSITIMRTKG
ncbi:hypothetical protein RND81_05G222900 [Saponaria officinalis]|uniref:Uncharacterized protein n=1 Tax=Saponaria officinalis TaxID=3572 RepID=A0AAW1L324_SAPOF